MAFAKRRDDHLLCDKLRSQVNIGMDVGLLTGYTMGLVMNGIIVSPSALI